MSWLWKAPVIILAVIGLLYLAWLFHSILAIDRIEEDCGNPNCKECR